MTGRCALNGEAPCPILALFVWRKGGKLQIPVLAIRVLSVAFLALVSLATFACHSYHIDATIENRTGSPVQLLEVDYPNASFGVDSLAAGATFNYRFQVHGSGPLKLSYTAADGKEIQTTGPTLAEREQGQLEIVLLPGDKAEFHPQLAPP